MEASHVVKQVRAALEHTPRVNLHRSPITVELQGQSVVLEGEVAGIDEKRAAVESAKAVPGVAGVVDHVRVRPTETCGDGAVRDAVCRHLMAEPAFTNIDISCRQAADPDVIARRLDQPVGSIDATVENGVVTLRGHVISWSHKRLAGVLAWWAFGCRDVVNELDIRPPEDDNDEEIREAIELVLNKDPLIHSSQITSRTRDGQVVLRGLVANDEEKQLAERDVWYIEGVRDVVNELEVYRGPTGREPMPANPPPFE